MGQLVKSYIRRFRKAHRKTRRRVSVLFVLACFVAVGVFWQLRATGIAMINETDCGLTEHTHTDACYEDVLVCNILESDSHTHTAECYEKLLTCGLEEHTHTVECIIDTTADVETAEDWEATLPELTGVWADDVVAIAESQLGYTESTANYTLDEDSTTHKGYTRYGEWAENLYGDWDGLFAMFCLSYGGISEEDFPMSAGANAWVVQLEESGFYTEAAAASPQIGDLIFLDTDADGTADRVGILTALDEETLTVVQGDYAETEEETDAVCQVEYAVGDASILGYGVLPIQEAEEEEETAESVESVEVATDTTTVRSSTVRLMGAASEYAEVTKFYLFIFNNTSTTNEGPTKWDNSANDFTGAITDVLSYTDEGETYYLIPVSYFEKYLSGSYSFDPTNSDECLLYYIPNANDSGKVNATGEGKYVYVEEKDSDSTSSTDDSSGWYLQVQVTGVGTYKSGGSDTPRSNVYFIPPTYQFVLNLGNNNGTNGSTQYGGDNNANTLRYTIDLEKYVSGRTATINLPCDDDLGQDGFVVYTNNKSETVSQDLGKEADAGYNYKLVGWYNIATNEYYDVSEDGTTATIDFDDNNVFYADWVANSYSIEELQGVNQVITEDTSSFVTINMFDYNELFNLYSTSLTQSGLNSETWTDILTSGANPLEKSALEDSFIFFDTGMCPNAGLLMNATGRIYQNMWTGNSALKDDYKYGQYPDLLKIVGGSNTTNSTLLQMLFNTEADGDDYGVTYVGTGNYLFSYNNKTYKYSFDSETSTAVYDVDGDPDHNGGRFYVYNGAQKLGKSSTSDGSFLPYNQYSSSGYSDPNGTTNGTVNYWFGMETEVSFYLPQDTSEGSATGDHVNTIKLDDGSTTDMTFEFSGDDDVWIFVDDTLVLDLGGDHNRLDGTINFSTNTIEIKNHPPSGAKYTDNVTPMVSETTTFDDLDLSAGSHTLKVYYLERGASASNLALSFTVSPSWVCLQEEAQTVVAEKTWYNAYNEEITGTATANCPEVLMGLFKGYTDSAYTVSGSTYTVEGTEYILDDNLECKDLNGLLAYFDDDSDMLFVRVDTQTLSYDADDTENYGWSYTWQLLDDDSTYEVQELNTPTESAYEGISVETGQTDSSYWEVVNYEDLANMINTALNEGKTLTIALTDGAQTVNNTANSLSYPKTVIGYAVESDGNVTGDTSSFGTDVITFSQAAVSNGGGTYTYGAAIGIPEEAQWTLVPIRGGTDTFTVSGLEVEVPTFYLKNENDLYLRVVKPQSDKPYLTLTNNESEATPFSYNTLGELNTEYATGLRIIIDKDGTYALVSGRSTDIQDNNIKICIPASYSKTTYTAKNTLKAYTMPEAGGSGVQTYWILGTAISGSVSVGLLRKALRRRRKSA